MGFDAFLVFDTSNLNHIALVGESLDQVHKGAVEIKEFSFGVENPATIGSVGGSGSGKAKLDQFVIKKFVDNTSPQLFNIAAVGAHFKSATLFIRKARSSAHQITPDYLTFTFSLVFVSSIDWSGSSGDDTPQESVTFTYGALKIAYRKQDKSGVLGTPNTFDWSQITNSQGGTA
ncbi:MAG: Hcp family type VI secretion system effector [Dehalococcoidia bacterium]